MRNQAWHLLGREDYEIRELLSGLSTQKLTSLCAAADRGGHSAEKRGEFGPLIQEWYKVYQLIIEELNTREAI